MGTAVGAAQVGSLVPAPAAGGDFSSLGLSPQHPALAAGPRWLPWGGSGQWVGALAAGGPRGGRDSLGQTAAGGDEVSQAGWLPEPDVFGKFRQNNSEASKKQDERRKGIALSPSRSLPLLFLLCSGRFLQPVPSTSEPGGDFQAASAPL